jgi:CRP/FNR family transcriptional regulator, nitrogen oxide reductase regulator
MTMTDVTPRRGSRSIDLRSFAVFEPLDEVVLNALKQQAVLYRLKRRELLYQQGEEAHSIYLIQQGGVRLIEHTSDDQQVNIKVYGAGDLLGLLAISGSYAHPSSAEAIDDTQVIGIAGEAMRKLMRCHAVLGLLVVDLLIHHVHHAHSRIRHLVAERVEQRLARGLLHYCEKFGQLTSDQIIAIDITLSQQDMAEFSGTTVETVNRTLKIWEDKGYIRRSRQHVDVLNRDALAHIAEDRPYLMQG